MHASPSEEGRRYSMYFWDQRLPHVVKLDIERRTGTLLERDPGQTRPLVYAGQRKDGRLELHFEASMLNGTLYSLNLDTTADCPGEARLLAWLRDIHVTNDPGPVEFAVGERYERMLQATVDFEAKQAAKKDDPAAIAAAQQAVLDAFRAGKRYRLAIGGPEGIYTVEIQMENGVLVKRETGEQRKIDSYSTREEVLAFLRSYFVYAASKDTHPHRPPEVEIWKYIGYQLK